MSMFVGRFARLMAATAVLLVAGARSLPAAPLPAIGADQSRVSVSGLSSGAYMAGQFQVAYSTLVTGAGLVAGGPYACAYTPGSEKQPSWLIALTENALRAQNQCMADTGTFFSSIPAAADLIGHAKTLAQAGKIDGLENLRNRKIYLFWGQNDDKLVNGVVTRAQEFFELAGIPAANIAYVKHPKAAHAFVTEELGLGCGAKGSPYINGCKYDQAGAILAQVAGPLKPAGIEADSAFVPFEQMPYANDLIEAGLSDAGIAYIPADCRTHAGCGVHVAFHGCEQGGDAFMSFVKNAGYARWAESNRLIILFPRVRSGRLNPKGCWDWWGYTGPRFLERDAPQMLAIRRMIERLALTPRS